MPNPFPIPIMNIPWISLKYFCWCYCQMPHRFVIMAWFPKKEKFSSGKEPWFPAKLNLGWLGTIKISRKLIASSVLLSYPHMIVLWYEELKNQHQPSILCNEWYNKIAINWVCKPFKILPLCNAAIWFFQLLQGWVTSSTCYHLLYIWPIKRWYSTAFKTAGCQGLVEGQSFFILSYDCTTVLRKERGRYSRLKRYLCLRFIVVSSGMHQ